MVTLCWSTLVLCFEVAIASYELSPLTCFRSESTVMKGRSRVPASVYTWSSGSTSNNLDLCLCVLLLYVSTLISNHPNSFRGQIIQVSTKLIASLAEEGEVLSNVRSAVYASSEIARVQMN
jgi:hypothetical protein